MNDFVIRQGTLTRYTGNESVIVVPCGVTKIGHDAFKNNSSLTTVTLPDGVSSLGSGAFESCSNLTQVTLPASLTTIGKDAFAYCGRLTQINFPDGLVSIGDLAFYHCSRLTKVTLPEKLTSLGRFVFEECSSLTQIDFPDGLKSIGEMAFWRCGSLAEVILPASLTRIDRSAFWDCRNLTQILVNRNCQALRSADGMLIQYGKMIHCPQGKSGSVTVPKGVSTIGEYAFYDCNSLTQIIFQDGLTAVEDHALMGCSCLTQITLPEGVLSIGDRAFDGCKSLERINLPESLRSIGERAFKNCDKLKQIVVPCGIEYIGCIGSSLRVCYKDGSVPPAIECFQGMKYDGPFSLPASQESADHFDSMIASGNYMFDRSVMSVYGYPITKVTVDTRIKAALYRIADKKIPIADELKPIIVEFLEARLPKTIRIVESKEDPSHVYALVDAGVINEANVAKVKKLLKASTVAGIRDLADTIERQVGEKKVLAKEVDTGGEYAALVKQYYSLDFFLIPKILKKDGTPLGATETCMLLTDEIELAHNYAGENVPTPKYKVSVFNEKVSEILESVDTDSLQDCLLQLARNHLGATFRVIKRDYLAYPICRFANEEVMETVCKLALGLESKGSFSPFDNFRKAVCYSTTREALVFAEKFGRLDYYASLRGTDEDTIRDKYFSNVGLNESGEKQYFLGAQTVTIRLQPDFSYEIENETGKRIKSIPKRKSDSELYAKATDDFTRTKKETRNIVKRRCGVLFDDFLSGAKKTSTSWQNMYQASAIMRQIMSTIVWEQEMHTFMMTAEGPIDSYGCPYTIGDEEILVAHPMEMKRDDLHRWQRYLTAKNLKQPFEQMWEPVIDPRTITEDRYEGEKVPVFYFMNREKHGIYFRNEDFSELSVGLKDCSLECERTVWRRHEIERDDTFTLGKFRINGKYTRRANHIVSLLDRWTIVGRLVKDDVSVRDSLESYTLAQIMSFIDLTTKNNCPNCTAMLLEYKHAKYPDVDPMAEFTLDW